MAVRPDTPTPTQTQTHHYTYPANPITKINWEHDGVKPDIVAPAVGAQQTPYVAILRTLSTKSNDPDGREFLQKAFSFAEKDESEMPVHKLRQ